MSREFLRSPISENPSGLRGGAEFSLFSLFISSIEIPSDAPVSAPVRNPRSSRTIKLAHLKLAEISSRTTPRRPLFSAKRAGDEKGGREGGREDAYGN